MTSSPKVPYNCSLAPIAISMLDTFIENVCITVIFTFTVCNVSYSGIFVFADCCGFFVTVNVAFPVDFVVIFHDAVSKSIILLPSIPAETSVYILPLKF